MGYADNGLKADIKHLIKTVDGIDVKVDKNTNRITKVETKFEDQEKYLEKVTQIKRDNTAVWRSWKQWLPGIFIALIGLAIAISSHLN